MGRAENLDFQIKPVMEFISKKLVDEMGMENLLLAVTKTNEGDQEGFSHTQLLHGNKEKLIELCARAMADCVISSVAHDAKDQVPEDAYNTLHEVLVKEVIELAKGQIKKGSMLRKLFTEKKGSETNG